MEKRKEDPKIQEFLKELQQKINDLPAEDKAKLEEMKNSDYAHDEETIISLVRQENKGLFTNKIKLII